MSTYATPEVGVNAKVTWQILMGSLVTLKNSDWDLTRTNMIKEAPNTTDGMLRAPGLYDAKGNVKGHVDTTVPIEGIVAEGSIGTLTLYRNNTKFFSVTAIIENLNITTGVDSVEDWTFSWSLQSGLMTNPT